MTAQQAIRATKAAKMPQNALFAAPMSRRNAVLWAAAFFGALVAAPYAQADVTYEDVSGQTAQPTASSQPGAGVTRIATPYYAVFLEDALFPDGFAYEYLESLEGAFGVLNVYTSSLAPDDGQAAATGSVVPAYRIYCVPSGSSTSPFGGTYAVAECTRTAAGSYDLAVARPYEGGFDDSGVPQPLTDSPAYAATQDLATAMCGHLSGDTTSRLESHGDGAYAAATPWYTVSVPAGMFANGWYYTYDDGVSDWSGDGSGAYFGRVLSVREVGSGAAAFQVACVHNTEPQGEYAVKTVGTFGGDWEGWSIVAYRDADYSQRTSEEELALLEPYAALVSVTGDPNMNPPSIW